MNEAVDFFSRTAAQFDQRYQHRQEFADRYRVWGQYIDTYVQPGARLYDMGCGSGMLSFYAAHRGADVTGVDGAEGMVRTCEAHRADQGVQNCRFMQAQLPDPRLLELGTADVIISSSVLEYVKELPQTLDLFGRLSAPGSLALISIPNRQSFYRKLLRIAFRLTGRPDYYRYVVNVLSLGQFTAMMEAAGFRLIEHTYFNFRMPLSGLFRRLLPAKFTANLFLGVFRRV